MGSQSKLTMVYHKTRITLMQNNTIKPMVTANFGYPGYTIGAGTGIIAIIT